MLVEILQRPEDPLKILNTAARQCYFRGYAPEEETADNERLDEETKGKVFVGDIGVPYREIAQRRRIEKLVRHGHLSVTEHCVWVFGLKGISRACSHQLVRHRIGVGYSQQSQRYCAMTDLNSTDFVVPDSIAKNKAAYDDYVKILGDLMEKYRDFSQRHVGIKDEDKRYLLPNAAPTNLIVSMNIRALLNFFQRRLCSHAQTEIRTLASKMLELLREDFFLFQMPEFGPQCHTLKYCPSGTNCRKF
jgi:thymidylate synthase (FAD)